MLHEYLPANLPLVLNYIFQDYPQQQFTLLKARALPFLASVRGSGVRLKENNCLMRSCYISISLTEDTVLLIVKSP